jgi:hypothetical protein
MIVWLQLLACPAAIVFAGTMLSKYGDFIAEKKGAAASRRRNR